MSQETIWDEKGERKRREDISGYLTHQKVQEAWASISNCPSGLVTKATAEDCCSENNENLNWGMISTQRNDGDDGGDDRQVLKILKILTGLAVGFHYQEPSTRSSAPTYQSPRLSDRLKN